MKHKTAQAVKITPDNIKSLSQFQRALLEKKKSKMSFQALVNMVIARGLPSVTAEEGI